jgi:hypothetical protein
MEHIMETSIIPYLHQRLDLHEVIQTRLIHTAGAGESQIDHLIGDLEHLTNPTVGLAAHAGRVDVRITAKAGTAEEAQVLLNEVETEIRQRLGGWVYGADQDTLEQVALGNIAAKGWKLGVLESGLGGALIHLLADSGGLFIGAEMRTEPLQPEQMSRWIQEHPLNKEADIILGVTVQPGRKRQEITLAYRSPEGDKVRSLSYGGPPGYASMWAANQALDLLRKI